jgi:5-methyltetrahydropteroyltriglutamate--homocysteine methyltransferase
MVGVIDVASDVVETPRRWPTPSAVRCSTCPRDRLIACTNCGLAPMRRPVAEAKLRALAAGAALARQRYGA